MGCRFLDRHRRYLEVQRVVKKPVDIHCEQMGEFSRMRETFDHVKSVLLETIYRMRQTEGYDEGNESDYVCNSVYLTSYIPV